MCRGFSLSPTEGLEPSISHARMGMGALVGILLRTLSGQAFEITSDGFYISFEFSKLRMDSLEDLRIAIDEFQCVEEK